MKQLNRQLCIIILCISAYVLSACSGFEIVRLERPSIDAQYSVQVKSIEPELKLLTSLALRSRGFQVVEFENSDFVIEVLSETSSDDIMGMVNPGTTQIVTMTYSIEFKIENMTNELVIPVQTKTWESLYGMMQQSINSRNISRLSEVHNLRRKAGYYLADLLTDHVLNL